MELISIPFFLFFCFSLIVYYSADNKYRNFILLIFSSVFISFFSVSFVLYAFLSSSVNYYTGRAVSLLNGRKRKIVYYIGQSFNIGGLIFFKYINFIFELINGLIPDGWQFTVPYLDILVPVGISYYTFQGISYLYLIFKAKDKPENSFVNFSLYMLFFPKLLAGPIERHRIFLPQLREKKQFDDTGFTKGVRLFLWGALKKVAIADVLFVIVDSGVRHVDWLTALKSVVVFLMMPVYMYTDFSGYTDMARGMGQMFGYRLAINFNFPLFARSVSEFWRRWHISLSSWCNDFIFVRLLLKHKRWGNYAFIYATFITFIIIGLWHGASLSFVVLGLLQAVAITIEFLTNRKRKKYFADKNKLVVHILSSIYVYVFFAVSLSFFLTPSVGDAFTLISGGISGDWSNLSLSGFDIDELDTALSLLFVLIFFTIELIAFIRNVSLEQLLPSKRSLRVVLYITAVMLIIYYSKYQNVFIYENF
jgi:D-alanyl-lipoteichoic acid acyltransferase DltB (MBOAT superfamily)